MKKVLLFIYPLLIFFSCTSKKEKSVETSKNKKVIAYVTSWQDNWGNNYEKAKQITHINYAFANIKEGRVVEGNPSDAETLKKLNTLKQVNKDLKILISVGGWSWSNGFSDAVLTEASREKFANSAVDFMLRHKIDGIDLDWEYPGLPGAGNIHRPEDKDNFTAILKLLRKKLDSITTKNDNYLLTIATGAFQSYLDHTNMKEAHKYLDFINIMTYDFYTGGQPKTGHHSNLFASAYDDRQTAKSARKAVNEHVSAEIPVEKIVLGVPFYGRWWKGANPNNNGLFSNSKGISGSYSFKVISDSLKAEAGFVEYWDDQAKAPYIWRKKDSLFITYDNSKSMLHKVDYVKSNNLGGVMFWQFNADNGELLNTIYSNLYNN